MLCENRFYGNGNMKNKKKIGLALSGGGYRAAIYHIGTLRKLNAMGVLKNIDVISSISGGSITNAFYAIHYDNFKEFEKMFNDALSVNILMLIIKAHFLRITLITIFLLGILILSFNVTGIYLLLMFVFLFTIIYFFQFKILDFSSFVSDAYDKIFFKGLKVKDLKCNHNVLINATNMDTGRLFSFSNIKMGDSKYTNEKGVHFKNHGDFKLSKAVMASSAYPLLFNPICINKTEFIDYENCDDILPALTDGGVYDNQGSAKLFEEMSSYRCDIVIASDGGKVLEDFSKIPTNSITLLVRTIFLMGTRIDRLSDSINLYGKRKSIKLNPVKHSLYWDANRIIPEFIKSVKNGIISEDLLLYHKISNSDIVALRNSNTSVQKEKELIERIEENINYKGIIKDAVSLAELEKARQLKTSLLPIKEYTRDILIKHAEVMTELTLKIYAPFLLD